MCVVNYSPLPITKWKLQRDKLSNVEGNSLSEKDFPKARLLWVPVSPRRFVAAKYSPMLNAFPFPFPLNWTKLPSWDHLPILLGQPWDCYYLFPEILIYLLLFKASGSVLGNWCSSCYSRGVFFLKQRVQGNNSSPHLILDKLSALKDWSLHSKYTNLNHGLLSICLEHSSYKAQLVCMCIKIRYNFNTFIHINTVTSLKK